MVATVVEAFPLVLVVACALIDAQGRVLLCQRPLGKSMAGLWEFPGGKIESGESPEAALQRELFEELGITVSPEQFIPLTFASHRYDNFQLLMPLFVAHQWQGNPVGREGQVMAWVGNSQLRNYPMPAADIPLVEAVIDYCKAFPS